MDRIFSTFGSRGDLEDTSSMDIMHLMMIASYDGRGEGELVGDVLVVHSHRWVLVEKLWYLTHDNPHGGEMVFPSCVLEMVYIHKELWIKDCMVRTA